MAQPFVAHDSGNLAQESDAGGRVQDAPRGNFKLFVHPKDWVVDYRGKLVPVVSHISKEVGAGSVTRKGDFSQRELEHIKNGWVPIPHDVLGKRDYLDLYLNVQGQKVYRTVFQVPDSGPDGQTVYAHDESAYDKFLDILRLRGVVKPPSIGVVKGLLHQRRQLYNFKTERGPRNQTDEARERFEREMRGLRLAIEMLEDELSQSEQHYGPEHSSVTDLLDELLDGESKPQQRQAVKSAAAELLEDLDKDPGKGRPRAKRPARKSKSQNGFVAVAPGDELATDDGEVEVDV